jgi:hypothetical protein
MKKIIFSLLLITIVSLLFSQYQIFDEDFTHGIGDWTIHNGTAINRWVYGNLPTHASISGVPITQTGVYITNNTTMIPWAYTSSSGNAAKVYITREVDFPESATDIRLSFRWAAVGRSANDYMRVYLAPAGYTPTVQAGTVTGIGPTNLELYEQHQIGDARYNLVNTWTTTTINLPREQYAGTTRTLMFAWRNDIFGAGNPPVAIDYVRIDYDILPPHPLTYTYPAQNADVYTRFTFRWEYADTGPEPTRVTLSISRTPDMSVIEDGIDFDFPTNSWLLPASSTLEPNTEYFWQVTPSIGYTSANNNYVRRFITNLGHISPPVAAENPNPANEATLIERLLTLSWEYPETGPPVDFYQLVFSTEPDFDSPIFDTDLNHYQTDYEIVEPLEFGETYYWKVIPRNLTGMCATPPTWSFTVKPLLPPPLENLVYLSPIDGAANLNYHPLFRWSYTESEYEPTHFTLTISKYPNMASPIYTSTPELIPYPHSEFSLPSSAPHHILEQNTQYYWQITPVNDAGSPPNPIIWSFKTAEQILPPVAATLVFPQNNSTDIPHDDLLVFKWLYHETDPFVDSFIFSISENSDLSDPIWSSEFIEGEMETGIPIILELDTPYFWRVDTENTESTDGPTLSDIWTFRTWPIPRARPLKVTLLEPVDYPEPDWDDVIVRPTFRWEYDIRSYPADEITLTIYTDSELTEEHHSVILPATETSYLLPTDKILELVTPYWWQAIPSNELGPAENNDTFFFMTEFSSDHPDRAIPIYPEDGEDQVSTTLTLEWDYDDINAQPIWNFSLKLGKNPDMIENLIEIPEIPVTTRTYTIETTLELYTDYYWQVIPSNKQGQPEDGVETWTFKTEPELPDPVILIAPANHSTDIEVITTYTWGHATTGIVPDRYIVSVATDEDFLNIVDEQEIEHPIAMYSSIVGLNTDTYHYWRVVPIIEHGEKSYPGKGNQVAKFKTKGAITGGTGEIEEDDEYLEIPFGFSSDHSYTQSIYRPAQIGAMGIITEIAWMIGDAPFESIESNITIYMANVLNNSFSGPTDWVSPFPGVSFGFTQVFDGLVTITNNGVDSFIDNIKLDTEFIYNGMTNLLIVVKQRNSDNQIINFRVRESGSSIATLSIDRDIDPSSLINVMNPANIGVGVPSNFIPRIHLGMKGLPPMAPPGSVKLVSPHPDSEEAKAVSENTTFEWKPALTGGFPQMYIVQFSLYEDFRVYDWVSFVFLPELKYIYRANASGGLKDGQLYYWRVNSFSHVGTTNGEEVWTFTTNNNVILDADQPGTDATPIIRETNVFNQFYRHTYTQSIYRADHIKASGEITDISFLLFDIDDMYTSPIKIYMAHTNKTVFTGVNDWITPTEENKWALVYDGPINLNPRMIGPQFISLDTVFDYNGVDNLLIAMQRDIPSPTGIPPHDVYIYHYKYTTIANTSSISARSFDTPIDINTPPSLDAPNIIVQNSNYLPSMYIKMRPPFIGLIPPPKPIVQQELKIRNFPNPFNPDTIIYYEVLSDDIVTIEVFNIKGQRIKTLVDGHHRAGDFEVTWSGRDEDGRVASSGVYLYRMTIGDQSITKKMVLLK